MRLARTLLIGSVVLVLLVVVADRVGAWVAQRTVAEQVASELADNGIESAPPEVNIDRVPFLTQVAAGRYESVTLRLRDVGAEGVRLPLVELTATDVTASVDTLTSGSGEIRAERVDGTATIGYASVAALPDLNGLEDLTVDAAADGGLRVRLRVPADLLGAEFTLSGTGAVAADDGQVRVRVESLELDEPSQAPPGADALLTDLSQQLSITVPLPPLPYGLTVESVRATPAGLVVGLSARDVPLAR